MNKFWHVTILTNLISSIQCYKYTFDNKTDSAYNVEISTLYCSDKTTGKVKPKETVAFSAAESCGHWPVDQIKVIPAGSKVSLPVSVSFHGWGDKYFEIVKKGDTYQVNETSSSPVKKV